MVSDKLWADWDRRPISIHHNNPEMLEEFLLFLRNKHNIRKHSIVMKDHENGGFVAFIYSPLEPKWVLNWTDSRLGDY